jgi:hypothetical protein
MGLFGNSKVLPAQNALELKLNSSTKIQKLFTFQEAFIKLLKNELSRVGLTAIGSIPPSITYSSLGSAAKYVTETTLESAAEAIPIVGKFVKGLLSSIPTQLYEKHVATTEIRKEAGLHNHLLVMYEQDAVDLIIEQTSYELSRICEFQIVVIETLTEVEIFAKYCVEKIMNVALYKKREANEYSFTVIRLLEAVLLRPADISKSWYDATNNTIDIVRNRLFPTLETISIIEDVTSSKWKCEELLGEVGVYEVKDPLKNFFFFSLSITFFRVA